MVIIGRYAICSKMQNMFYIITFLSSLPRTDCLCGATDSIQYESLGSTRQLGGCDGDVLRKIYHSQRYHRIGSTWNP